MQVECPLRASGYFFLGILSRHIELSEPLYAPLRFDVSTSCPVGRYKLDRPLKPGTFISLSNSRRANAMKGGSRICRKS